MTQKWTIHENGGAVGVLKVYDGGLARVYQTTHYKYNGVQQEGLQAFAKERGIKSIIAEGGPGFAQHMIDTFGYPVTRAVTCVEKERLYASLDK